MVTAQPVGGVERELFDSASGLEHPEQVFDAPAPQVGDRDRGFGAVDVETVRTTRPPARRAAAPYVDSATGSAPVPPPGDGPAAGLAPRAQSVDLDLDVPVDGAGAHGGEQLRGTLGETAVMVGAWTAPIRLPVHDADHPVLRLNAAAASRAARRPSAASWEPSPAPSRGAAAAGGSSAGRAAPPGGASKPQRSFDRQGQISGRLRPMMPSPSNRCPVLDGCGREPGCPGPPAQIRTCALTHTAPTLGGALPRDTPSRPCVRCVLWSRRFPLVEALPSRALRCQRRAPRALASVRRSNIIA